MTILYLALDDTDTLETRGTGHLARSLATELEPFLADCGARVVRITRHQLLVDPRVPCTKNNSCNVVHLDGNGALNPHVLAERAEAVVRREFVPGSDPGLCVGDHVPAEITAFGRRAQQSLVTQAEARRLAMRHDLILRGLGGTEDGVIGALAGVGLAASGDDGRHIRVGRSRELDGLQPISAILAAGVSEVRDMEGHTITEGEVITGGRLRPALRQGRAILYVERGPDGWLPLKLD
ncbi:MAG: ABC transporter substrate-binding protein [Anaerolineae bacterium]|nr:ABC transporter substrate-binding protein [Anaerolineae bacterium]